MMLTTAWQLRMKRRAGASQHACACVCGACALMRVCARLPYQGLHVCVCVCVCTFLCVTLTNVLALRRPVVDHEAVRAMKFERTQPT